MPERFNRFNFDKGNSFFGDRDITKGNKNREGRNSKNNKDRNRNNFDGNRNDGQSQSQNQSERRVRRDGRGGFRNSNSARENFGNFTRNRPSRPISQRPKVQKPVAPSVSQESRTSRPLPPDDVCWGRGPVMDLVKTSPERCTRLLIANNVRPPYLDELVDAARAGHVVYQLVAPEALDRLCPGEHHQGVACRLTEVKPVELEPFLRDLDKSKPALLVVLDHIEDPHNVGAIVRSAECGGASAVIYSKRREALPGGTVVKTSAGASLRLPMIAVVNITRTLEQLQDAGFWVVGLEGRSDTSLWSDKMPDRLAIVVGAEGEGLSRLVSESCDQLLRIPITGGVGSLNASVAAALGIFEWRRSVASIANINSSARAAVEA